MVHKQKQLCEQGWNLNEWMNELQTTDYYILTIILFVYKMLKNSAILASLISKATVHTQKRWVYNDVSLKVKKKID